MPRWRARPSAAAAAQSAPTAAERWCSGLSTRAAKRRESGGRRHHAAVILFSALFGIALARVDADRRDAVLRVAQASPTRFAAAGCGDSRAGGRSASSRSRYRWRRSWGLPRPGCLGLCRAGGHADGADGGRPAVSGGHGRSSMPSYRQRLHRTGWSVRHVVACCPAGMNRPEPRMPR